MLHLDLFSGIGGFALGLERAGFKTIAFCEIDPYCRAVLSKRWPKVPVYEDIRTVGYGDLASTDARTEEGGSRRAIGESSITILTGGFPCQPWSIAGKRGGAADDRHLWPEMLRVIREIHPRWVVAENVPGLDGSHLGLDAVLDDLEGIGYETQTFEIPACAVGAPHLRNRIWIVSHASEPELRNQSRRGDGPDGEDQAELGDDGAQESMADAPRHVEGRQEQRAERKRTRQCGQSGDVGNTESERRREGRPPSILQRWTQTIDCTSWWQSEPDVGRVAHGIPSRVDRLRALGNAIVPQIAEMIGRAIIEAETD